MTHKVHNHLLKISSKYCKPLESIIIANGVINIEIPKNLELFDCLAQTVVEQQLSYKAAKSIWNQIKISSEQRKIKLIDYFDTQYIADIRKNGLSKNKIKAILGAKQAVQNGEVTLKGLSRMGDIEFKRTITNLWGFGDWSAEMIAIFYLGRTNVWSDKDLILHKGINQICDQCELTPNELLELVDPYQSYLALHIWRHKD